MFYFVPPVLISSRRPAGFFLHLGWCHVTGQLRSRDPSAPSSPIQAPLLSTDLWTDQDHHSSPHDSSTRALDQVGTCVFSLEFCNTSKAFLSTWEAWNWCCIYSVKQPSLLITGMFHSNMLGKVFIWVCDSSEMEKKIKVQQLISFHNCSYLCGSAKPTISVWKWQKLCSSVLNSRLIHHSEYVLIDNCPLF